MNIYITKPNEEWLRSLPKEETMSGVINRLIIQARGLTKVDEARENLDHFLDETDNLQWPVADKQVAKSLWGNDPIEFCKHDAVKGMCKKGCK